MTVYPNRDDRTLSDSHRRQLEESGISPDVAAVRGYYTARRRSEVPEAFKDYQRRPGLVIPVLTPSGERRVRLRPDRPRKGKDGRIRKYEQAGGVGCVLDVHPRNLERLRDPAVPLWVVEGEKKGDALTSRGECAVALPGVWNWQRSGEMLSDWEHVALSGRLLYVCFDSDAWSNPNVQLALERLVAALEDRGAEVLAVHLEDKPDGSKAGADDFLVAGGSVAELKMLARKFEPADVGRVRLSRDERLRTALEELRSEWWGTDWNQVLGTGEKPHWMRGYTLRDVEEALLRLAARWGKATPRGVRFTAGLRTISDEAAKGKPATGKAIKHLEAEGRLLIHEPGEGSGRKARSYTLLVGRAHRYHKGRDGAGREKVTSALRTCDPCGNGLRAASLPDVSRLRWSAPAQHKRIVRRKQKVGGRVRTVSDVVGEDRPRIVRLDPRRGAVVDALEASGGSCTLAELCELLHRSRPRDVRRRLLPMLEKRGIIECAGDVISLTAAWSERLEEERRRSGEIDAGERQKQRHDEERRQHRENGPELPAAKPPPLMGPERVQKIVAAREEEDLAARIERQRQKVGSTVEVFVFDKLKALGQIRLALLMEIYEDAGGDPWDIPPAVRRMGCRVERLVEYENRQFVFPPAERIA